MSEINYGDFAPDWWDTAGVTAEAVKTEITRLVDTTFGASGFSALEKQATEFAATKYFEAQQAMKAAADASARAATYADSPNSPLFRDAVASRVAYEGIAKSAVAEAGQVMRNAGADAALASKLGVVANVLGPAINTAQLGAAAATGDAYIVTQKAVGVLAGMAVGAMAAAVVLARGGPIILAGAVAVGTGYGAGKFWEWMWANGAADFYGISKGDSFSLGKR